MNLSLSLTNNMRLTRGSSFTPASLFAASEAGAWYDPNDLTSMYQTGTRASPGAAAVVDNPVGLLLDLSGNDNDATQSTAGSRPILRKHATDELYWLEFDGTDDHLVLPTGLLTGWTAGTGIFAAKVDLDPPSVGSQSGPPLGDIGSDGVADHYPLTDGVVYHDFLSTARKTAGDPGDMAAWHVGDFRSEASNWRAAFNGVDYHTTGTNTVGVGTAPMIGRSLTNYLDGVVGRIIIVNKVLTGSDLSGSRTWVGEGSGVVV